MMQASPSLSGRLRKIGPLAAAWAALLMIGGYTVFGVQLVSGVRYFWSDFLGYYAAGRIVTGGHGARLYDLAYQNGIESALTGVPTSRLLPLPYDSPPHLALLMAPFALLPYGPAAVLWILLSLILFLAAIWLLCRGLGFDLRATVLATLCSLTFFPVFVAVVRGQLDAVVFIFLVAAFLAWRRGRDGRAGVYLGLGLAKFHLLFGLPVLLLARASWRALAGLAAVAAAAVAVAAAVLGPAVWLHYVQFLLPAATGSETFARGRAVAYSVYGLAATLDLPRAVGFAAAAVLLLAYFVYARGVRRDPDLLFAAAIPVSIVVSPHQGLQDLSLMLLPGLLAVRRAADRRLPEPWLALVLFGGLYAVTFASASGAEGTLITLLLIGIAGYLAAVGATSQPEPAPTVVVPRPAGSGAGRTLVAILTYNERGNIERLVPQVLAVSPELDLLIIDDSSPDGTGELVDALAAAEHRIRVMHRPRKLGVGSGYRAAFEWMLEHGYAWLVHMDADFSHRPEELPRLLDARPGADVVLGSRNIAGGSVAEWSLRRRLLSRFGSFYVRSILGIPVHDCTTGYKCVSRHALEVVDRERLNSRGYAIQLELLQAWVATGLRLVEVPITFPDREVGRSKMSWRIALEAAIVVLTMRFRARRVAALPG